MEKRRYELRHKEVLYRANKYFKTTRYTGLKYPILSQLPRGRWFIKNFVCPQGPVLDVAGGYGRFGIFFQLVENAEFEYHLLDLSKQNLDFSNLYFWEFEKPRPIMLLRDLRNPLPYKTKYFDQVWLFGWWIDKFDAPALFKEIYRVLRKGGILSFDMPNPKTIRNWKKKTTYPLSSTREQLVKDLREVGFKIEKLQVFYHNDSYKAQKSKEYRFFGGICKK